MFELTQILTDRLQGLEHLAKQGVIPGDILYTFMGERLIRLTVLDIIDDSRLRGEDEENIYVFYSDSCYESENEAYLGMERMLEKSTILIQEEIKSITEWLDNRPSASMDPFIEERERKVRRLYELKNRKRTTIRPPSRIMESQVMPEE